MDALIATSFDRYARYLYTHRLRTRLLGPAPLRILDVGDPYGTLGLLFPDDDTTSLDLFVQGSPVAERHSHIIGSGMRLPFADGSFDLVTAHDVLEHVPPADRTHFLVELLRVSAGPVVVAAPFADPRTELCERLVNAFYVAHLGRSLEPLDEHAEHGLPDLLTIVRFLQERQLDHIVYSDGWLFHWLAMMLLKAHYVSLGAARLDRATDAAFNRLLREQDRRSPHYRRALILRPPAGTEKVLGAPVGQPDATSADHEELEALAVSLVHALPPGQDPAASGSALRSWLEEARGRDGSIGILAGSLTEVLDAAEAALADAPEVERATRPTIAALVVPRTDRIATERVMGLLRSIDGIDTVVECDAAPGGDVVAIALALDAADTEAILIVDPDIDLDASTIHRVIDGYRPGRPCVGYHRPATSVSAMRASIHADGDDALYVARELLLVDRDLYRGLGGLDGRFRNGLDEVDFGWRVNTLGFKVTTVGPAPWTTSEPDDLAPDLAVFWCWLKNLELRTLQRLLPVEVLAMLADGRRPDVTIDWWEGIESLLEARAQVAKVRAVPDETLLERFGNLRMVGGDAKPAALRAQALVADALASSVTARGPVKVAFVTDEAGEPRARALAASAAAEAEVTVGVHGAEVDHPLLGAQVVAQFRKQIEHAGVLVGPVSALSRHVDCLRAWAGVLVVDLADAPVDSGADVLLRRADVVLFECEAQRERWRSCPALQRRASGTTDDGFLMVVTTPNDPEITPVTMARGSAVVVDLIDHPDPWAAAPAIDATVEASRGAPVVVAVADGTPMAAVMNAGVVVAVGAVGRRDALARAAVVVRPDGGSASDHARSAAFGADVLAAGVPLVTTPRDPAGPLVERTGAGVVVVDVAAVATAVERALQRHEVSAGWRVAAASASIGLRPGARQSPFLDVIRRPWKWHFAHAGGGVPLHATPEVASLLAAQEAAVVQSVTMALEHEQEARLRAALQVGAAETARLTLRLQGVESELAEARAAVGRLRGHPAVRLLLAIRRRLRGS